MAAESSAIPSKPERWNKGLTRKHWRVLTGSYLGWLFDGYETFALVIALPFAMATLLTPEQSQSGVIYGGLAIGMTLLGWGLGGLAGGVLADYFGQRMEHRYCSGGRILARPRASQGSRFFAIGFRHGGLHRRGRLVCPRDVRPARRRELEDHVPCGRSACALRALFASRPRGIGALAQRPSRKTLGRGGRRRDSERRQASFHAEKRIFFSGGPPPCVADSHLPPPPGGGPVPHCFPVTRSNWLWRRGKWRAYGAHA